MLNSFAPKMVRHRGLICQRVYNMFTLVLLIVFWNSGSHIITKMSLLCQEHLLFFALPLSSQPRLRLLKQENYGPLWARAESYIFGAVVGWFVIWGKPGKTWFLFMPPQPRYDQVACQTFSNSPSTKNPSVTLTRSCLLLGLAFPGVFSLRSLSCICSLGSSIILLPQILQQNFSSWTLAEAR